MAPTRELAKQDYDQFEMVSQHLKTVCIYGGVPYEPQGTSTSSLTRLFHSFDEPEVWNTTLQNIYTYRSHSRHLHSRWIMQSLHSVVVLIFLLELRDES